MGPRKVRQRRGVGRRVVFAVVKKLETDLSWLKHQSGESQQHG
jgi:hypothetical protein